MTLLLFPFRLAFRIVSIATVLLAVAVLAFAEYTIFNYLRPASQTAIDNLANGTVRVQTATSEGTGALIRVGQEWDVVTAAHVVGESKSVQVLGRDGTTQRAPVKSIDREKDVAIITVKPSRTWVALPVSNDLPNAGERVLTLCFFDATVRQGPFLGPIDDVRQGAQHIASLNLTALLDPARAYSPLTGLSVVALFGVEPGCSGAPLVDRDGTIVGIVLAGSAENTIAVAAEGVLP